MMQRMIAMGSGGGSEPQINYSKITQKLTHSATGTTESTSTGSYTPTKDEDAIVIAELLGSTNYTSYAYLKEGSTKVVTLSKNGTNGSPKCIPFPGSTGYGAVFEYYKLKANTTYKLAIKNGHAQNNSRVDLYVLEEDDS